MRLAEITWQDRQGKYEIEKVIQTRRGYPRVLPAGIVLVAHNAFCEIESLRNERE